MHVLFVQFESGDAQVLALTLRVQRFRDRYISDLQMPAEHGLHFGHAMLVRYALDRLVLQHLIGTAQRTPGLGDDAMCGVVSALFGLLEVGVQLNLVDAGGHCGGTNQHIDVTGQEVADADMPDQSVTLCVDKSLPCLDVEALGRVGPVDQIQVEIIESESA